MTSKYLKTFLTNLFKNHNIIWCFYFWRVLLVITISLFMIIQLFPPYSLIPHSFQENWHDQKAFWRYWFVFVHPLLPCKVVNYHKLIEQCEYLFQSSTNNFTFIIFSYSMNKQHNISMILILIYWYQYNTTNNMNLAYVSEVSLLNLF